MNNQDWEVVVMTESNYVKKVRVSGYTTRQDAEAAALGMTGGTKVFTSNPVSVNAPTYYEDSQSNQQVVNNYYPSGYDSEEYHQGLDELEEEMYDLQCRIAIEEGEEPPTYEEFMEYLNSIDGETKSRNPIKRFWNKLTGWM